MNDELTKYTKKVIKDNKKRIFSEALDPEIRHLFEFGDEFGDVFGDVGWSDFTKLLGDPGKVKNAVLGSIGKIDAKTRSLLTTVIKGIPSLVIPFVSTHYEKIYIKEKSRLNAVRSKYPEAFRSASEIFGDDAKLAAFMINPVLMLTASAASASTESVLSLASSLSVGDNELLRQIKQIWRHINRMPGSVKQVVTKRLGNDDLYYESVILEASTAQKTLAAFLGSPKIKQRLMSTRVVQDIQDEAETIMNETLHDIIGLASQISQVTSIDDIKKLDSSSAARLMNDLNKVPEKERQQAMQAVVQTFKEDAKRVLVERLNVALKEFAAVGVPDDANIINAYSRALQKISSS